MGTFTIYNVYSGEEAQAEPDRFIHLDDVRNWISSCFAISPERQLILTAKSASHLKLDHVVDQQQVYVFDKALISASPRSLSQSPSHSSNASSSSSSFNHNNNNINSSKLASGSPLSLPIVEEPPEPANVAPSEYLGQELQWAQNMSQMAESSIKEQKTIRSRCQVISAGLDLAMQYMMRYSTALNESFQSKIDFAIAFEKDLEVTREWKSYLALLNNIPLVSPDQQGAKLSSWIDVPKVQKSYDKCEEQYQTIRTAVSNASASVQTIMDASNSLSDLVARSVRAPSSRSSAGLLNEADCSEIIEEISAILAKIKRDMDASGASPTQRMLNVHSREFDVQIKRAVMELHASHQALNRRKESLQKTVTTCLSQLSRIQSNTAEARAQLRDVGQLLRSTEDYRAFVARVIDMPFLYGMYLIEMLRRNEWFALVKQSIQVEAEKMGHWHDDEQKRREDWEETYRPLLVQNMKYVDTHLTTPNIELNLSTSVNSDPATAAHANITKDDLDKYIAAINIPELRSQYQDLKEELSHMLEVLARISRDLSETDPIDSRKFHPLRRESIGLLSANALGLSSTTNTESDPNNEKKIRAYESRIRKLEDLLHKQLSQKLRPDLDHSRASTPGSDSQITPRVASVRSQTESQGPHADSPGAGGIKSLIGASTTGAATASSSPNPSIVSRLHFLETQNAKLEKDKAALESQLETANSVKKDLLANMSSQEAEFLQERKQILAECEELKLKLEDLEDWKANEVEKYDSIIQEKDVRIEVLEEENTSLGAKLERLDVKTRDLSQRLLTSFQRSCEVLELMGLQAFNDGDSGFRIARVKGLRRSVHHGQSSSTTENQSPPSPDTEAASTPTEPARPLTRLPSEGTARLLHWMGPDSSSDEDREDDRYNSFLTKIYIDYDMFRDSIAKRFKEVEHLARKLQKDVRHNREVVNRLQDDSREKLSLRSFKVGDLALFLPTRDPTRTPNPWAAFNVNAPHYFLKQEEAHQLEHREYLVARITKIEERVVNRATDDAESNMFDLSDGLKWHLIEATPEQG